MGNNKALLLFLLLIPLLASAHGGRTDKYGCHNDRKNGGYHCHGGAAPNSSNLTYSKSPSAQAQPAQSVSAQLREANAASTKELVLNIQAALNHLGYEAGAADGVLREKTVKAIKHFQVDSDLPVDGKPTYLLLEVLLKKVG